MRRQVTFWVGVEVVFLNGVNGNPVVFKLHWEVESKVNSVGEGLALSFFFFQVERLSF